MFHNSSCDSINEKQGQRKLFLFNPETRGKLIKMDMTGSCQLVLFFSYGFQSFGHQFSAHSTPALLPSLLNLIFVELELPKQKPNLFSNSHLL